jgi:hypothetical protein
MVGGLVRLIQEIGSYAGYAAILGLAVLSALYFSQARDVRRLREWAGRAPERDAEARARVGAASDLRRTPAAQAQAAQAAQPAAAVAAGAGSGNAVNSGAATAQPAQAAAASKAPAVAAATPAAAAAGASAANANANGPRPSPSIPSRPGQRVSAQQTAILSPKDVPRERWYRRLAPRYVALIVAGVLVVGGGIAVGVVQLAGSDSGTTKSTPAGNTTSSSGGQPSGSKPAQAPLRPGDISVAVLNATPVAGLASQFGDRAQADGFKKDNVGNAPGGQQRAESVVLYAPGHERDARFVRRKFGINNIEAVDAQSRALAPQADVILVIGADKTQ